MRRGGRTVDAQGWGLPALALTAAFVAHNMEAITGLPGWIASLPVSVAITEQHLSYATTGLTLLVAFALLGTRARPGLPALRVAAATVAGALLAKTVAQLGLCALTLSYMPGTGTAALLLTPAAIWLLRRLPPPRAIPALVGAVLMAPVTWAALWLATVATA